MSEHTHGDRGRVTALAASATVLVGALVLIWALVSQQPDPPTPAASSGLSETQGPSMPSAAERDSRAAKRPQVDADDPTRRPGAQEQQAPEPEAAPEQAEGQAPEPLAASAPVSVDIPGIAVSSPLHPLGLNDDGTLQVPSGERYDEAAWYEGSPTPGEVGPTVIEGHVTSQGSTPSVFFELGALELGDTVDVTREDGTVVTFEVYATDTFPKDDFPKVAVYGNTDAPELRLITCGGDYDPEARAHVDNIVVFARMVAHA
jgi:sortase (surface protein transpeptidase)